MKTFKLVDSTNNYCLKFELYVAIDEPSTSEFGKTHDLVVRLLQEYIGKSYIIFMDNFDSSPYLFYELKKIQTGAVGLYTQIVKVFLKGFVMQFSKKKAIQKLCCI